MSCKGKEEENEASISVSRLFFLLYNLFLSLSEVWNLAIRRRGA